MSYCRFGWESSDAYIFATTHGTENVIECCGCALSGDHAAFTSYGDVLRHIGEHRAAGHHILASVDERIYREIANPDERWIEVGDLPDSLPLDPGPRYPEEEVFAHARAMMGEEL